MPSRTEASADYDKKFAVPGERYHSVTQFGANIYKITQHYGMRPYCTGSTRAASQHSDVKLSSSISRTKRFILELALSNEWDYFITMTLDEKRQIVMTWKNGIVNSRIG